MSSSLAPISRSVVGLPRSRVSAATASMAAVRAVSMSISAAPSTPKAAAMSRNRSPVASALNAITGASRMPLATPCGAE